MRYGGGIYWRWKEQHGLSWVQLHPAVAEVQPCLQSNPGKRPGSRNSALSTYQSLVQFNLCLWMTSIVSVPGFTLAGAPLLYPDLRLAPPHMAPGLPLVDARPTWLRWWERTHEWTGWACITKLAREQERVCLCRAWIILSWITLSGTRCSCKLTKQLWPVCSVGSVWSQTLKDCWPWKD